MTKKPPSSAALPVAPQQQASEEDVQQWIRAQVDFLQQTATKAGQTAEIPFRYWLPYVLLGEIVKKKAREDTEDQCHD